MADLTLSEFSDALSLVYRPKIVSSINRNVVLANLLPIVPGEGKVCSWTAKFSGRSDGAQYAEGADMADADFDHEDRVPATLSWATLRKGAKVTGLAEAAAASNYNAQSAGGSDIMSDEIADATLRLALGVNTQLYSGTSGSNRIVGLETIVAASGSYATIDPATYTEWASTVESKALSSLSFQMIRSFLSSIYDKCGEMPTFLICNSTVFDAIGALFGAERRWMQEISVPFRDEPIKLSGGYKALEFDGIPIVRERAEHITSGALYAINANHMRIRQLPSYKGVMSGERMANIVERLTGERLPEEYLEGMVAQNSGLVPTIDVISKTGDADKTMVKAYLQLECDRRNTHGRLNLS